MCSVMKFSLCLVLMNLCLGETILIMGPKWIRPNREYQVVASNIFGETKGECLLNLRLEGRDSANSYLVLNLSQTVVVDQDTNKMIAFHIPSNLTRKNYSIIIEGKQPSTSSAFNINGKVLLKYFGAYWTGLIQLSKPVFRPDDTLQLRVIVVDADLKPPPPGSTVFVYVYDPFGNFFRKWTNVSLNRGIFEDQIAIPTIPVLGIYRIEAIANDEYLTSKTFQVRNYELYSIDFYIYPTVVPLVEHRALNLTVDVRNYLGKPVSGTVEIDLYVKGKLLDSPSKWDINGLRQIYLPFAKKLVSRYATHDVLLKVTFTEKYTNRTNTKNQRITVYNYKYKVTHNSKLTYRPGSPFTAILQVTHLNEEPANNVTLLVEIGNAEGLFAQNYTTNMTGYITVFLHTNKSTIFNYLQVFEGKHLKLNETIYQPESTSDMFIEVKLLTRVKYNRLLKLMVSCSHGMTILLYYVISKGNIVDAGFFRPNQMIRYPFQVVVSARLSPCSKIMVATIVNNKMILGAVDIFINELDNPIEINIEENISEDGLDPGDEIELAIRGRPGSLVALTAYDQRLQQRHKNHDVFLVDIWKMFITFHNTLFVNTTDLISIAGLFAWTSDTSITISDRHEYDARGMYPDDPRHSMPEPYRTEFWESWLWQNVTIPPSGRVGLVVTVPHSTTSWCISGISMDPEYGLGSIKYPIQFSTAKILFILDHLPKMIKRGRTESLHFTLFSNFSEPFEATVTMFNAKHQLQFVDLAGGDVSASKNVIVPPNSATPISFLVKAMKLGELEIRLNASVMQGVISDSFRKIISVFPEDIRQFGSVDLHYGHASYSNKSFDIPFVIDESVAKVCLEVDLTVHYELMFPYISNDLNVSVTYGDMEKNMHIDLIHDEDDEETKNMTLKSVVNNGRHIHVTVSGFVKAFIQTNWQVLSCHSFNLEVVKQATANKLLKQLNICCSFIPEIVKQHSNDTMVEVSIPIGYAMDEHSVLEKTTSNLISRVEVLHDGTTLKVYFKWMDVQRTCFSVFAYRRYSMPVKRPSYIMVQDSHRPELNAMKMFEFHKEED